MNNFVILLTNLSSVPLLFTSSQGSGLCTYIASVASSSAALANHANWGFRNIHWSFFRLGSLAKSLRDLEKVFGGIDSDGYFTCEKAGR